MPRRPVDWKTVMLPLISLPTMSSGCFVGLSLPGSKAGISAAALSNHAGAFGNPGWNGEGLRPPG